MDEICVSCHHELGRHFITLDERKRGCDAVNINKNVVNGQVVVKLCVCEGLELAPVL